MGGRGGRGGARGGRGGSRGGFGAGGTLPPMGLSFADIQSMSREGTALYPPVRQPVLTECTEEEKRICELQLGFTSRLRKSAYYLVEPTKITELPRYSDKYKPSITSQPKLKRADLHAPFFPPNIFESYFNPRKRRKSRHPTSDKKKLHLDEIGDDDEGEKSVEDQSEIGSGGAQSDYDVDEEYDNDYAENYFDNGEGDDMDDLGGGDDGGGGGNDYD